MGWSSPAHRFNSPKSYLIHVAQNCGLQMVGDQARKTGAYFRQFQENECFFR